MAAKHESPTGRLGVWIFGARGGLATTMIVGAHAIARGLTSPQGLLTETELCDGIPLAGLEKLVFGGHEVRRGTLLDSAREIQQQTGTIPYPLLEKVKSAITKVDADIARGSLVNAGRTIQRLVGNDAPKVKTLRAELDRTKRDIRAFMKRKRLTRCVCVNLSSTEPKLRLTGAHRSHAKLTAAIDADRRTAVRSSTIYALAAAELGLPFIHFTPSNAALVPGVTECFAANGTPYMGADGKTGETLVKSALAPMFKYRNLRVLSWQGYNMLGDRDGAVLSDAENKQSKVATKDALLAQILGYPLHTHVGIDYVPSLGDLKTAWDFVHFQGFLDYRMSMQFTWHGCDAILAAPLVLDMVRLADLAARRGEAGPMGHLACFFKQPVGDIGHDLHMQWHVLCRYLESVRRGD
ncbi:MAG: inositol-3-phosphate synthase [Planctomycetes bacterium]|nr:inositol-3-phosphate synthase [Planctomycetota bacterium]